MDSKLQGQDTPSRQINLCSLSRSSPRVMTLTQGSVSLGMSMSRSEARHGPTPALCSSGVGRGVVTMSQIHTDQLSAELRSRSIRPGTQQILISRISGSLQEADLSEPPNCDGYGRIRHFRTASSSVWPPNPLPVIPAAHRLGLDPSVTGTAQVFQNAACNWRCWYCYVPFNMLAANEDRSGWLTAVELVDHYRSEQARPIIIDCSGGQPDLVPEWVPWMMSALGAAGLDDSVYLWSDDNLSNDYFWRYLLPAQVRQIREYRNYGRVCCFKGFNAESFAFNTKAAPDLFDRQFELFRRLLTLDIDLYCYATFTSPVATNIEHDMTYFVDRLMAVHPNLPLRVVPLQIERYDVIESRMGDLQERALAIQQDAIVAWNENLRARFSSSELGQSIATVDILA